MEPASGREVYVRTLAAMSALPQPRYVAYRLESSSEGLQVDLATSGGQVWLNIRHGTAPERWSLRHRTYDYESEIVNGSDGRRFLSQRSFFDPTWYGAYRALRQGMLESQDPAPPHDPPPVEPTPTPGPVLKSIGMVSVMGPAIYDIEDRGSAPCPNGDSGRALHLTRRDKDPHHQLSDVIVDLQSMNFCMMRFATPSAFGFHGTVEVHYANVGGYWMQTDGLLDGTIRAFGVSMHHGTWHYRLVDMQFPSALPPEVFQQS
ncbi:MAG TPA: hypothetical protein VGT98_11385 [Candidatus Elarobacter sp.]|nr:hypothetical protein [Candidatus Elarobacter sp.]HEV2738180.1 hypothetical protein [Candidatus Elarobacter sp.]